MEPFEYAIKKDVRNNPIVREVDDARQRELGSRSAVAVSWCSCCLFYGWQHFEMLRTATGSRRCSGSGRRKRSRAPSAARDRDAASRPAHRGAGDGKLHLVAPTREEAIVIERVRAGGPPARSVVARR